MVWTDERIADLVRLWNEGLTTGEIGRRIGVSKNAVVGKAHRLELIGRPSPIKRNKPEPKEDHKINSVIGLSATTCRWPYGDPKEDNFYFCGKRSLTGKPYCAEHCATAYVTSSKGRKEEAT